VAKSMQSHLSCILSDTFINDFKVLVAKNIKQSRMVYLM